MRYDIKLRDSPPLHELDKILAIAGVIFSILLIVYMGREIGRVVYLFYRSSGLDLLPAVAGDQEKPHL